MYKGNPWTDNEIVQLQDNKVPEGRTLAGARFKAAQLGIPFCPITKERKHRVEVKPVVLKKIPYTEDEIKMIMNHEVPPGRSKACVYAKAQRMGVRFHPKNSRSGTHQVEKIRECRSDIEKELMTTCKIRATARKFGLTFSTVWHIADEMGLTTHKVK